MALSSYHLRYELPFKDVDGNQWRARIFDRDEAGSVERLNGTGNPVSIYYEADEEFKKGIIGSSCSINVYGVPNLEGGSDLSQFFTSDEERFYVKIEYTSNGIDYELYWTGFLHQDEYTEHITADPYTVELVALDRLGTIKTRMDELGYHTDSEPTLFDIIQSFVDETNLEFVNDGSTGLITENGFVDGFLNDQVVAASTFFQTPEDNVQMRTISEVVNNKALAIFCRIWQQEGKLMIRSNKPQLGTVPDFTIPSEILSVNDDLFARHLSAKRVTNISIETGARNLLFNPSFERDALGSTTPIGWAKPAANTLASIEVSNDSIDNGSGKSLKTINNRISDSTFSSASESQRNTQYTLLETTSRDIQFGFFDDLQGIMKIRFFINNVFNASPYEIRFSMTRSDNSVIKYYDWNTNSWTPSFTHAFFDAESNGEWQSIDLPFVMRGFEFYEASGNVMGNQPIILRIHTMNYDDGGALSNVEVFYDNCSLKIFNANGDSKSAFLPTTRFYNLSTDSDTSTKSGSLDIEIDQGITTAEFRADTLISDKFYLMNQKVLGQYWNENTGNPEDVTFNDNVIPSYVPLPVLLMSLRKEFDESSKRIYSGTLATIRDLVTNQITAQNTDPSTEFVFVDNTDPWLSFNSATLKYSIDSGTFVNDLNSTVIAPFQQNLPLSGTPYKVRINVGNITINSTVDVEIRRVSDSFIYASKVLTIADANTQVNLVSTYLGIVPIELVFRCISTGAITEVVGIDDLTVFDTLTGGWVPLKFGDKIDINYNTYTDGVLKAFTRFDFDLKDNRYRIDAINLP